ncbi:galactokinase [Nocardioides sp. CER19]|uniref:galactokinase n=1 Tax=Nocardioides sp. CER19 TaxID=3038538 RepID=UPI002449B79C|nr:galactokinase [Nocardioides sp. CER19]MDH2415705.1 galactokinase [Nocardioides sp. CER19]
MSLPSPATPAELSARAERGLLDRLGATATVVGWAPGRVNLIGEHTDYNGGLVLPVALPHATAAAAVRRDDDRVRLSSAQAGDTWSGTVDDLAPGRVTGWASYAGGVLWALREAGFDVPGLDLHVHGTVPLGAGLSSSASIECSVAFAVLGLLGVEPDLATRRAVVDACIKAETEVAGAPTGGMDQTISVFAEAGTALLIDFTAHAHQTVQLALDDRRVLVTDTRVSHELTDGGYGTRRQDCEEAARALGVATLRDATLDDVTRLTDERVARRARHVVTETARVPLAVEALASADWSRLGELFAASHASMRDDFEISTPELDLAVATAVASGADAARMTGGGFGGSIVAIVPSTQVDRVVAALDDAFADAGLKAPAHLLADPSGGAVILP